MPTKAPYRGSITREQWLLRETRVVAKLRAANPALDTAAIVSRAEQENLFQYPTEREVKSIARACDRRLTALSDDVPARDALIALIANGTLDQAAQVNLYALARDNRIVWDFLFIVVRKAKTRDPILSKYEIVSFLDDLRLQDSRAASWSEATMNKIRQVLVKSLESCGMYDRKSARLAAPLLDRELELGIRINGDEVLLPAFGSLR